MMTHDEFKHARSTLGYSAKRMAEELGYTSKWADRTVRKWESGQHPIPGSVMILVRQMVANHDK